MDMRQFESDHAILLQQLDDFEAALRTQPERFEALADRLLRLGAKVQLHLVVEDEFLYPLLVASNNREVVHIAEAYRADLGGLRSAFAEFVERYARAHTIADEYARFVERCNELIHRLRKRIQREDGELYPQARRL